MPIKLAILGILPCNRAKLKINARFLHPAVGVDYILHKRRVSQAYLCFVKLNPFSRAANAKYSTYGT